MMNMREHTGSSTEGPENGRQTTKDKAATPRPALIIHHFLPLLPRLALMADQISMPQPTQIRASATLKAGQ